MTFFVAGSVQSCVPWARAMKLATVLGACFSKNWQVMRPIDVSITTVGPLGTMLAAAVACGASGSGSCAGGLDCCAKAEKTKAKTARRSTFFCIMPNFRVNHRAKRPPARKRQVGVVPAGHVWYWHEDFLRA